MKRPDDNHNFHHHTAYIAMHLHTEEEPEVDELLGIAYGFSRLIGATKTPSSKCTTASHSSPALSR